MKPVEKEPEMNSTTTTTEYRYANCYLYNDIEPYEIVRRISEKTLEVRRMRSECDPRWVAQFVPGGFWGHVTNNYGQRWVIASDDRSPVIRIRYCNRGYWKDRNGNAFHLGKEPRRFRDFND